MTQQQLNEIIRRGGRVLHVEDYCALVEAAQTLVDTADHVVISQAEYDWLVERSHVLETLEL